MHSYLLLPVLTGAMLLGFSVGSASAGSFLGPVCYGTEYTYRYPNRANSVLGCGPGNHCQAWHPFFKHRWFRRNQCVPNEGMPVNTMPPPEPQQVQKPID